MPLKAQFKILILALHISSIPDFNLVQLLVQDFLLQSFLKVTTPLEDVRRCYVEHICIKKENIKNTFSLVYFL